MRWQIENTDRIYGIHPSGCYLILLGPVVLTFVQCALMAIPATRPWSLGLLEENNLFELLTFVLLFAAGVWGLWLALNLKRSGDSLLIYGLYSLFSLGLLVIAMEEIAWGQWWLGFETPEAWRSINQQGETTLHNVPGLQGRSEWMRLLFGVGGLVAFGLSFVDTFKRLGMPVLMLPCFLIIVGHASVDVFNDFVPLHHQFDYLVQRSSEFIEFLISVAAFFYLWLNRRRFLLGDLRVSGQFKT